MGKVLQKNKKNGHLVAKMTQDKTGDILLRAPGGKLIGRYYASQDATKDAKNRKIGKGNLLATLVDLR